MADTFDTDPIPTEKTEAVPVTITRFRDEQGRFVSAQAVAEALADALGAPEPAAPAEPAPELFERVSGPAPLDAFGNPDGGERRRVDGLLFDRYGNPDGGAVARAGLWFDRLGNATGPADG